MLSGIMLDAELLKPGGPLAHMSDLVNKLLGPACGEIGVIFGDTLKVHRIKNFIKTTEKTNRMLEDAGLNPNPVPSRVFLPIVEASSVEDDDDLQERWAGLLASASQEGDSFSPSFAETLKQLTPDEAKHFSSGRRPIATPSRMSS
jgi:Abortive infection alpha